MSQTEVKMRASRAVRKPLVLTKGQFECTKQNVSAEIEDVKVCFSMAQSNFAVPFSISHEALENDAIFQQQKRDCPILCALAKAGK